MTRTNVYLLYHFFHPDDVISARLFTELGVCLADAGCRVTAMPSNSRCHDYRARLPRNEEHQQVLIRRVYRPPLAQHRFSGRIINTLFLLAGWTWRAIWMKREREEVMIVGTDPILAVVITIAWRLLRPRAKIVHWCHDLYPDAAIADGLISEGSLIARFLRRILRIAYRRCDVIADLGPCMRAKLRTAYGQADNDVPRESNHASANVNEKDQDTTVVNGTTFCTLVPWALVEPDVVASPNEQIRQGLFGNSATLGILYSGNLGRAHHFGSVLQLARLVNQQDISFCFAGRGPGIQELRKAVTEKDSNIKFAGFAEESELFLRLTATDVHLVTLRENWTGTVVPSKFFGALAVGRPVLFAGSPESAIAEWIDQYGIGWVLTEKNQTSVAERLIAYSASHSEREQMCQRCWDVYQRAFSKSSQLNHWCQLVLGGKHCEAKIIV